MATLAPQSCACGSPATFNGRECPPCARARLLSVRIDPSLQETRSLRMYDSQALADSFGDDAQERMMDETHGLGAGFRGPDGDIWRKDRKTGDPVPVSPADLDSVYLGGPETEDVV
jgi:hypothetical protein